MRKLLTLVALLVTTTSTLSADWSPEAAARYLDSRQKEWFSWKPAMSADGPCVSCHTGMTYLLARPALRRVLKETQPTMYEVGLLDRLRAKVGEKPAGGLQGVETIFSAMFLSREDATKTMSAHTQKAFDQLWTLQSATGRRKAAGDGTQRTSTRGRTPNPAATAQCSPRWRHRRRQRSIATHRRSASSTASLRAYLQDSVASRRLHDRLALLLARAFIPDSQRESIVADALARQQADGGWTTESLGPWHGHPDAPPSPGSNAYATAFTTFALLRGGRPPPSRAWRKR